MPKKILLADDSLTIQKVVELTFSDSDFDLICVSNGTRALEKVQEDRPDLILADVVMPEKNGYEVCEAIKGDPSTAAIPVILLTGTFEPFDRARAERIGADAIVSKPFDSQQLLDQVEALLARAPETSPLGVSRRVRETPDPRRPSREDVEPFEAGFAAEDFSGTLRVPFGQDQTDPFEEEYGRGDVDSAIQAFERAGSDSPFDTGTPPPRPDRSSFVPEVSEPESFRDTGWLEEEGERTGEPGETDPFGSSAPPAAHWRGADMDGPANWQDDAPGGSGDGQYAGRDSRRPPSLESEADDFATSGDDTPTLELPTGAGIRLRASEEARALEEISAEEAEILFDIPDAGPTEQQPTGNDESGDAGEPASPEPRELEALAQTSSIPELAQMLSSVSRPSGELSDAEIDRVASRVVEKLSDRILREIAWEVIPDMAEIVIKKRIKELESGVE